MIRLLYEKVVRPILSAHDSPEAVAGGAALGIGVALTPTVGVQMPLVWLLATLCGANRVVALALVWLSNPITVAPMYYSEYGIGCWILGRGLLTSYSDFHALWTEMAQLGYLDRLRHFSDAFLLPLVVGSLPPAVLLGASSYPLSLWWIRRSRRRVLGRGLARSEPGPIGEAGPVRRGEAPPASRQARGLTLVLLVPALFLPACLDGETRFAEQGVTAEAQIDGRCTVFFEKDPGETLFLVSPFHVSRQRDDFAADSFEGGLDLDPGSCQFLALHVFRFGSESQPLKLGEDGLALTTELATGRVRSREPSTLVDAVESPADRMVLGHLLGLGPLPPLKDGQSLRLLVVMPTTASLEEWPGLSLELPGRVVLLKRAQLDAAELDAFLARPTAGAFERAVEQPVPPAAE